MRIIGKKNPSNGHGCCGGIFEIFNKDLPRTPEKALRLVLDTHFPGVRIKKAPEMADQPGKIRAKSEDWKIANQVVTEEG